MREESLEESFTESFGMEEEIAGAALRGRERERASVGGRKE
jgi:hypothetical protein